MRALPEWRNHILVERTGTIQESRGRHPDILITHDSIPPVPIEVSFLRGDADRDAKARLGAHYTGNGREIRTAIAIYPPETDRGLTRLNVRHVVRYALHQHGRRFPKSGFVSGDIHDLGRLVASTAVPKEDIERVADLVAGDVTAAANILESHIRRRYLLQISKTLYQRSALSGLRTTMILWLNALLVQQRLLGEHDIPLLTDTPSECLAAWRTIHRINWQAIFGPAINILEHTSMMAPAQVREALSLLIKSVERIGTARLGSDINIGAELFPKVAEDRKESAAFYTQPATAELLAALTITPNMRKWSDADLFRDFRIIDMTCGTGTLLRFGYLQVKEYHRPAGTAQTLNFLHRNAMEYGLVGTDVSPIATHLTSTSLAVDTNQPYGDTQIGWVVVGNQNRTGAIEYMALGAAQDLFGNIMGRSTGQGERTGHNSVPIHSSSADVILMNPPYSRTRGGQSAFDIAGLSEEERAACQKRWGELIQDEPCIKTAGMAATFLCVARKKIKRGGRIGFVLPRTAAFADAWEQTRSMVERDFENIMVVAVSSGRALGKDALSADTNMEEMLLTATRKESRSTAPSPVKCVTLYEPVTRLGEAAATAKAISNTNTGPVMLGEEIGVARLFRGGGGLPWSYVGVEHDDAATISYELSVGTLYDLEGRQISSIPMTTMGELFKVGKSHDSIGHRLGKDPRGAFVFHEVINETDTIGKYRSLWKADAKTQTRLVVTPTHKGTEHNKSKTPKIWNTRSTLFYSRGMRWNTQCVMAATTRHPVMGGRAWTSLYHDNDRVMKAFALYANSIYGMMVHWTRGQRSHSGRSTLQVNAIKKIPCPDLGQFDDDALDRAATEFDRLSTLELLPAYLAVDDSTRAGIDDAVSNMLGVPNYDTDALTRLWCAEPSVRGLK